MIQKDVIVNDGDVLFAWSGTLCMTIWCNGKAGLNQHIFKVTSEKFPKWFYYCWTLKHLDKFIQIAAGKATTMGHIKRNELDNAEVLLPDHNEILKMDKIMAPILEKYIENFILMYYCTDIQQKNIRRASINCRPLPNTLSQTSLKRKVLTAV